MKNKQALIAIMCVLVMPAPPGLCRTGNRHSIATADREWSVRRTAPAVSGAPHRRAETTMTRAGSTSSCARVKSIFRWTTPLHWRSRIISTSKRGTGSVSRKPTCFARTPAV